VNLIYVSEQRRLGFAGVVIDVAAQIGNLFDLGFAVGFRFGKGIENEAGAVFAGLKVVSIRPTLNIGCDIRMKHGKLPRMHQAGPLGGLSGGIVELELLHVEQIAIGN